MANAWLGAERGFLSDWTTQRWVRATGVRVAADAVPWLRGPTARTTGVREDDFARYAGAPVEGDGPAGLLADFGALASERFDPGAVDPAVVDFYERTERYRLQLWSQWSPVFRPFGRAVDGIFARRLGQLQLPLAPLDTSRGVTSTLTRYPGATSWVRRRVPGDEVLYAGLYTIARPPLAAGPCIKVSFPLPNGHASVFLEPAVGEGGALVLHSVGRRVGDAGFYFVVDDGSSAIWVKPVPQLTERIVVSTDSTGELQTDHVFRLWRRVFLRLHYVMLTATHH